MPLSKGGRGYKKMPSSMNEDELFKTLSKNKPAAYVPIKKEIPRVPLSQTPVYDKPHAEPAASPEVKIDSEAIVGAIKNLNASVNMTYGLIKTVIVPVLVFILIIGIALLVKLNKV